MKLPTTKEVLVRLFTFQGRPYALKYKTRGYARKDWLKDKPELDKMIKEGIVSIVDKTNKSITYLYTEMDPITTK